VQWINFTNFSESKYIIVLIICFIINIFAYFKWTRDTQIIHDNIEFIQEPTRSYIMELILDFLDNKFLVIETIDHKFKGTSGELFEKLKKYTNYFFNDSDPQGFDYVRGETELFKIFESVIQRYGIFGRRLPGVGIGDVTVDPIKFLMDVLVDIIKYCYYEVRNRVGPNFTPWDFASKRKDIYRSIFGPLTNTINVKLEESATHISTVINISEEQAAGILLTLPDRMKFKLKIRDAEISKQDFEKYILNYRFNMYPGPGEPSYTVDIRNSTFVFSTPEFIQGALTAIQWIGQDQNQIIKDLRHYDQNSREWINMAIA